MSDGTRIEWTDATANVVNGCSVLSPGCTNCYAMRLAGTRMKDHPTRIGLTQPSKAGPVWTGEVRFNEKALSQVLHWSRPRMIFWNAHGDLFHEGVPDAWIDSCFAVMALTPQHKHQVLTKRSDRMRAYMDRACGRIADAIQPLRTDNNRVVGPVPHIRPGAAWWPIANVWLGVSVEDQTRAAERIPDLLATPAAVRWISAEPLLGPISLRVIPREPTAADRAMPGFADCTAFQLDALDGSTSVTVESGVIYATPPGGSHIDWVVAGGESGPGARPMHPDWARSLRDQCAAAGVPFLFKQWGEWGAFECVDDGSGGIHFESGIPMRRGFTRMRRWDGDVARGFGVDETMATFMPAGTTLSIPLGKRAAGRLLDGVQHDGYPA